ncbi:Ribosomal RNA small subunit methyltransferase I [Porphyridium purpureum]|uniref:Ribosomal RNA small subunit methyltransferase I n=1 Tax=Porphyridium purpureum TaxID=35688 RepID=A0A5J4Z6V1_PORPP|nr:Ribosomal RNA small subunit methyltransferase I [Porphyridium purpureum]|eukprot:POR1295..scf295_1
MDPRFTARRGQTHRSNLLQADTSAQMKLAPIKASWAPAFAMFLAVGSGMHRAVDLARRVASVRQVRLCGSSSAQTLRAAGALYVVATPIGNLEDISIRAARTLLSADVIVAEDTRHSGKLLEHLKRERLNGRFGHRRTIGASSVVEDEDAALNLAQQCTFVSLNEHNSKLERVEYILQNCIAKGQRVALVSDAGTPLISDPGALLIEQAHLLGVPVVPIPGPCALISALSVAGQPCYEFTFAGFLPKKSTQRLSALENLLKLDSQCVVLYESPFRVRETLAAIQSVVEQLGKPRGVTVARELTKVHEEILRFGSIAECVQHMNGLEGEPRGEFVLVVGPVARQERRADADLLELESDEAVPLHVDAGELLRELIVQGVSVKSSVSVVNALAQRHGKVSKLKNALYGRAQDIKREIEEQRASGIS